MAENLAPGTKLADIDLPDHAGNQRRLSELAADDAVLVQFFRGWWCPKEQAFFRMLVRLQSEAEVAYTRFVSISIDPPEVASAFRAGLGARWTFLCDHERRWIDRLDLVESTDASHSPYRPAVATLAPDLTIHRSYNGYWFWGRPTAEELRMDFRAISQAIRSDWEVPGP